MTRRCIKLNIYGTIKKQELWANVNCQIIVVDDNDVALGVVSLRDLVLSIKHTTINITKNIS